LAIDCRIFPLEGVTGARKLRYATSISVARHITVVGIGDGEDGDCPADQRHQYGNDRANSGKASDKTRAAGQ
jgi:hypothetical protein